MPVSPLVEASRIRKCIRDAPVPILDPMNCIGKALKDHPDKVCMSWSGGKCSTIVLHMTLKQDPNVPVAFNDAGVQFPETYAFIKRIREEWNLNLHVIKPETTFWKVVEEYGFPMFRGKYKARSKSKDGKPKCCQLLKEIPFRKFLITYGFEATVTGLRASESRMRMFGISQFGQYYYAKTLKHWRYHPIALWTQKQVDDYNVEHGIPVSKLYSMGHDRTGCWCCTGYKTWQKSLRTSHPKMYRFLAKQIGQPTLWEYLDQEDCRQFLEEERLL